MVKEKFKKRYGRKVDIEINVENGKEGREIYEMEEMKR